MKKYMISFIAVVCIFAGTANAVVPENSAVSAILMEADSGRVIYEDNANEQRAMASITKIMTTLLTIEAGNLDEYFTVDSEAIKTEGTSMGLKQNDSVTRRILCYGMMLPSGNDGANAAAVSVGGDINTFLNMMNERAKQIGMNNTNFVTPSGLDANGHYTTAYDMALLTREALSNHIFAKMSATQNITVEYGNPVYARTLTNSNKMLKMYDGAIGVKTGFTDNARRTLVSAATRNGVTLICVTLSDSNDWVDHTNLLDYGFSICKSASVKPDLSSVNIPVVGGVEECVSVLAPFEMNLTAINGQLPEYETVIVADKFSYAPVSEGDVLGEVQYISDGQIIASSPLVADNSVSVKEAEHTITDKIKEYIKKLF